VPSEPWNKFPRFVAFILWIGALFFAAQCRAEAPIPNAPDRWVTDTAGFISEDTRAKIDAELQNYQQSSGHQVVVWIGRTIDGGSLADFSVKTFQAWKIGRKGHDDGVLMVVLAKDRTIDIEVGYGLEDRLTDALSHRIIDEVMTPRLREGNADAAVSSGVSAILADIEGHAVANAPPANAPDSTPAPVRLSTTRMVIYGVLGLLLLLVLITHPSLAMYFLFSIFNGGRSGGMGGGGFSGGGGTSGGGGARGGW
jgi:uncharacterized protein